MEAIFRIPKDKYSGLKEAVTSDEVLSKQSLTFRDNESLDIEEKGYYLLIDGSEEAIKKAREVLEGAEELKGGDAEKLIEKIKSQEESAAEGFGSIFG